MQDDYTPFDLQFRSRLKDAEEPVSPRVWDAVSARLDRLDARRRAFRRWRNAGLAVAAAAAVALGVFFAGNMGNSDTTILTNNNQVAVAERPEPLVRDASPAAILAAVEPPKAPAAPRVAASSAPKELVSPAALEEVSAAPEDSFASRGMTGDAPADKAARQAETTADRQKDLTAPPAAVREAEEDPWHALMQEEASAGRGISLSLGGDLQTNGNPASGFRGMRRSSQAGPTTGITEISSESVYAAPLSFGIGLRYDFNERWAIGTGLTWSILGRSFSGIYKEVDAGGITTQSVSSDHIYNTQHYLGIPVNVYFNIVNNPSLRFYTYAGGSFEKNLLNRYTINATGGPVYYRESVDGIQISAGIGLGVEFMFSRFVGIYVDPSLRYYFNCYQPKSIRTQQPLMLNLEAGLRFNFGR